MKESAQQNAAAVPVSQNVPDDALICRLRLAGRAELEDLLRNLKLNPLKFQNRLDDALVIAISAELRSAAGNSVLNLRRGRHDFPYKQIVLDVADKLHPSKTSWTHFKLDDAHSVEEIEDYVYDRILARFKERLEKMSMAQRTQLANRLDHEMRTKGFPEAAIGSASAALMTGAVSGGALAGVIAPLMFGTLWSTVFGFTALQLMIGGVAVGGPVALLAGAATLIAHPSYSKTIPTVYQLIQIRKSFEEREKL